MKQLHRKREHYQSNLRSQFIQQYFSNKRHQLIHQLHNEQLIMTEHNVLNLQLQQKQIIKQISKKQKIDFKTLNKVLIYKSRIEKHVLDLIFQEFVNSQNLEQQKLTSLSLLINRSDFKINSLINNTKIQWTVLIKRIMSKIDEQINFKNNCQNQEFKNYQKNKPSHCQTYKKIFVWILLLIWKLKPKFQLFVALPKYYIKLLNFCQNKFCLALIAELSYDKNLLPGDTFLKLIMQKSVVDKQSSEAFCTIEILKNYLAQITPQNFIIHFKQCIFNYVNWLKTQFSRIISVHEQQQVEEQIKHYLIYLLNCVLNKLQYYNQYLKSQMTLTEILSVNQQIFCHSQNHSSLYFLIDTLKKSRNGAFFQLIQKTLILFVSFIQISQGQNSLQFSQILQIQKALDKNKSNQQTF